MEDRWNDEQIFEHLSHVAGWPAVLSSVTCGIAVVATYIFPEQRKFPNVVLVWPCVGDFVISVIGALLWLPGPINSSFTTKILPQSSLCRVYIYIMSALETNASILGIIFAYTLYVTTVKNMEFKSLLLQIYYRRYIFIIWVCTLVAPLITLVDLVAPTTGIGYCAIANVTGVLLRIVPSSGMFTIQLVFMCHVFKNVHMIKRKCSNPAQFEKPKFLTKGVVWLYLRYVGVLCNQFILRVSLLLVDIANQDRPDMLRQSLNFFAFAIAFLSINGLVVFLGNKSLRKIVIHGGRKFRVKILFFFRSKASTNLGLLFKKKNWMDVGNDNELNVCDLEKPPSP